MPLNLACCCRAQVRQVGLVAGNRVAATPVSLPPLFTLYTRGTLPHMARIRVLTPVNRFAAAMPRWR